jgi:hypothetical protein
MTTLTATAKPSQHNVSRHDCSVVPRFLTRGAMMPGMVYDLCVSGIYVQAWSQGVKVVI